MTGTTAEVIQKSVVTAKPATWDAPLLKTWKFTSRVTTPEPDDSWKSSRF
jgi:hypothetical protein